MDGLTQCMDADEHLSFFIDGAMPLARLSEIIESRCQWALCVDYEQRENSARFWYTSAEKLEPRVGERFDEPGAEYELPLGVGRDIKRLYSDLQKADRGKSTAEFLLAHPEHRHTARRVQNLETHPYAEIQDKLIPSDSCDSI